MSYRLFAALALMLASVVGCSGSQERASPAPFPFRFVSAGVANGGQLIEAAVAPEGENIPPTFRLWLAPPGLAAKPGETIRGVMRRGERGGTSYLLVTLAPAFYNLPPPSESSGALVAIDMKIEAADSVPLVLTVRSSSSPDQWLADAHLLNGGRFAVALDSRTKRGEFRCVDQAGDTRVFRAIVGLLGPG